MSKLNIKHIDVDLCMMITRTSDDGKVTLGDVMVTNDGKEFECKSLELPWKQNMENISCIPPNIYRCKKIKSPSLGDCFEITGVPYRTYVRGHKANFTRQILGCVAFGMYHADIDGDGIMDIAKSGVTFDKLMAILPNSFMLEIV